MAMEKTNCGTVVLFGPPNAGKSSLLNVLVGEKISATTHKPQTTRRQVRGIVTKENNQIVFVDVPGIIKSKYALQTFMCKQAMVALPQADIIVLVVDVTKNGAAEELALKELAAFAKIPVILAFNKIDVLKSKSNVLASIKLWHERYNFVAILPISVHKKQGLKELLQVVEKKLPKAVFMFEAEYFTDANEKQIVAELIREKIILELSQELPHKIAVTVDEFNEERRQNKKKPLVEINAIIHVERDSQKGIVIGKKGSKVKVIGERARKDIEQLLGCKVMLRLAVRVEPQWSKKEKTFHKLGLSL